LSEGELYAAVRSYVRQLASQVHPDRNHTNITVERQKQIFEAFEELDGQERFSTALTEFRQLKSEERNEINLLNASLRATRADLDALRSSQASVTRTLNEIRERESALLVKERRVSEHELRLIQFEREAHRNSRMLEVAERNLRTVEREREGYKRYVSEVGYLSANPEGATHVFDSRWVAVVQLARGTIVNEKGIVQAVTRIELKNFNAKSVLELYNLACLRHSAKNSRTRLSLSIYSLSTGRINALYGMKPKSRNYRVIGSVAPTETRSPYLRQSREAVTYGLVPWLVPGNILVRSLVRMVDSKSTGRKFLSTRFDTGHVILAAG
jgi:hypothetical protein